MRQATSLKDLERRDGKPLQLAEKILTGAQTWLDAVAVWVAHRTEHCKNEALLCSSIEVSDWSSRVSALKSIVDTLAANEALKNEPRRTVSFTTDPDGRLVALGDLLCPLGWTEHYLPSLTAILDDAIVKVLGQQDVALNQKVGQEVKELLTFLDLVDRQASGARNRLGVTAVARMGDLAALRAEVARTETPKRRGRPPGSIKNLRQEAANRG